ncbi:hypothetical protein [Streptomyces tagetis]|uniref:Uncharacterized protein n=1 Tax=Streptomyces tagetis TaxID=2820809 RepID=A0A940XTS2_9ACTN|nr:hypothetical protein [Streptomyces sp. RG38]MBQ0829478.1 hypothetical protein [Streptomyces sp. RG38]
MDEAPVKRAGLYTAKGFVLSLAIFCALGLACWFGYVQIFTKGLERLPAKVCGGAVDRELAVRVLPSARSAEDGARRRGSGERFTFSCRVVTSDEASLQGRVQVRPFSATEWLANYEKSTGDQTIIRTSAGEVEALAQYDKEYATGAIYVRCTPRGAPSYNDSEESAIVVESEVYVPEGGEATGAELAQPMTDIAYQLARHAYGMAGCEEAREFPAELPRFRS